MRRTGIAFLLLALLTAAVTAQDTTRIPTGVRLSTRYEVGRKPLIAVRPANGALGDVAQEAGNILQRDLDYSDRFEMGATPQALASGPVDYAQWNSLNVVYVIASELTAYGQGYRLNIEAHNIPFNNIKQSQAFFLPAANHPDFRLSVHAAADSVVKWLAGEPGVAATRIVFARWNRNGSELVVVDSDGQNEQRLLSSTGMFYSPAWSPDGRRIAYAARLPDLRIALYERDLAARTSRVISNRSVMAFTPSYSPDGRRLAFSFAIYNGTEIQEIDLERGGSPRRITQGRFADGGPVYSPDGQRIAFHSDRLGAPHIFVSAVSGGQATALTPLSVRRVKFTSPDWSPSGDLIVFTGESGGSFHLMLVDANRPGTAIQITETGINEDPSWAPDGRHIVFSGVGRDGSGLYVIDRSSGRTRKLVSGERLKMADWSTRLAAPGLAAAGN